MDEVVLAALWISHHLSSAPRPVALRNAPGASSIASVSSLRAAEGIGRVERDQEAIGRLDVCGHGSATSSWPSALSATRNVMNSIGTAGAKLDLADHLAALDHLRRIEGVVAADAKRLLRTRALERPRAPRFEQHRGDAAGEREPQFGSLTSNTSGRAAWRIARTSRWIRRRWATKSVLAEAAAASCRPACGRPRPPGRGPTGSGSR